MQKQTIILASASPRRAQLLDQIGVNYQIQIADINEVVINGELPEAFVQRLAKEKAEKISINTISPVLGACPRIEQATANLSDCTYFQFNFVKGNNHSPLLN